jgi:hypothetical protein
VDAWAPLWARCILLVAGNHCGAEYVSVIVTHSMVRRNTYKVGQAQATIKAKKMKYPAAQFVHSHPLSMDCYVEVGYQVEGPSHPLSVRRCTASDVE